MPNTDCDVLIIGGGPAGAMTALLCARERPELKVVLAEAEAAPRQRPCGEFLAPAGVRVLREAELVNAALATGARILRGMRLIGPNGAMNSDFRGTPGLGIRRERFDAMLQAEARRWSEVIAGTRYLDHRRQGGSISVRLQGPGGERWLRTQLLVGADGRQSAVRREAGLDRATSQRRFALACRARGFPAEDRVELHLTPFGQVGIAALGDDEVNVNLLLAEPSRAILKHRAPERVMTAALAATPALRRRCARVRLTEVMATGSLPRKCESIVGDGVALVGDAAGFCDPFTGDGISFALFGARLLATRLGRLDFPAQISAKDLGGYVDDYRASIGRRRIFGEGLRYVLARRGLAEHVTGWLGRSRFLSGLMANGGNALFKRCRR